MLYIPLYEYNKARSFHLLISDRLLQPELSHLLIQPQVVCGATCPLTHLTVSRLSLIVLLEICICIYTTHIYSEIYVNRPTMGLTLDGPVKDVAG